MKYRFTAALTAAIVIAGAASAGRFSVAKTTHPAVAAATPKPQPKVRELSLLDGEFDGRVMKLRETEWKKILTPEEFYILRQEGTEAPYTGPLTDNKEKGTYHCAACGLALFSSQTKFDSGTGWPSFYAPLFKRNVVEKEDRSLGEVRTEVECARCGSHLGHVFDDGPRPTGLRYCMNSVSLKFKAAK